MKRIIFITLLAIIGLVTISLCISYLLNDGEYKIVNHVKIDKPQEEVFNFVADMRNELKWNTDVQFMEKISEGDISNSTRFKAKWHLSDTLEVSIQRYIRPSQITFVNGGTIAVTLNLTLKSLNSSETEMETEFIAKPNGLVRAIFPFLKRELEKQEKLNMVNLKNYIENNG